jgi:hypothetical protein
MPARIEYRLGSIFDEECDLLVIPSSAGGTVTRAIREQIEALGISHPDPMGLGTVRVTGFRNGRFGAAAFASAVGGGGGTTPGTVEAIGRRMGTLAATHGSRVAAPLLGTGAGGISPVASARSLEMGFLATAPEGARLILSVPDPDVLHATGRHAGQVIVGSIPSLTPAAAPDIPPTSPPAALRPPTAPVMEPRPKRARVFISYSRKDAKWLDRLMPHLAHLERADLVWSDKDIEPGSDWHAEITEQLNAADVALLLVSAYFLASRFIREKELPPLLDSANRRGTTILPVIVSTCRFDLTPELSRFKAVNDPGEPLMKFRGNRLQAELDRIARAVEKALER